MNNRTRKIFLIFGFILLTIFGVICLYFQESDLPVEGALEMPSLHADVEVLTDSTGYCHFYAENNQDLYKAMGYVHASGHLPQMDNYLRVTTGTLSEVYGESTLEIDIFSCTMGFAANAERFYPRLDPEVTEVLQAYCDGINIYLYRSAPFPVTTGIQMAALFSGPLETGRLPCCLSYAGMAFLRPGAAKSGVL